MRVMESKKLRVRQRWIRLCVLRTIYKKMSERRLIVCMEFVDQGPISSLRKHVDSSTGSPDSPDPPPWNLQSLISPILL